MRINSLPRIVLVVNFLVVSAAHQAASVPELEMMPGPPLFKLEHRLSEIKTIRVGSYPKSVSISPDGRRAYICNLEGGSVDVADPESLSLLKRIEFKRTPLIFPDGTTRSDMFEEKPVEVAFTHGGRYVWISLLRAGGIVVHDTQSHWTSVNGVFREAFVRDYRTKRRDNLKLRFIPTGNQPKVVALSPDEKWMFVANWHGNDVTVIDANKFEVVKKIKTGRDPRGICFSSAFAYVANFASDTISEIDLKTLKKTRTFRHVGTNPRHLVLSSDGCSLYVSNHGDKRIRQIDLTSGETIRECPVGTEPRTLCASRSKNFLFVTNYKDNTISAIEVASMKPVLTQSTLRRPVGASFDPKADTLWVTGYWDQAVRVYKFQNLLERQSNPISSN